jgi:hypothetical protein
MLELFASQSQQDRRLALGTLFCLICVAAFFLVCFVSIAPPILLLLFFPHLIGSTIVAKFAVDVLSTLITGLFQDLKTGFGRGLNRLFANTNLVLNFTENSLKEYTETMLTLEELKEFKQAIDAETNESTKNRNQSLYNDINDICPLTRELLLDKNNPPITVISTVETGDSKISVRGIFSRSGFLGLLNDSKNRRTGPRHPMKTSVIMDTDNTTISIGFHEVNFNYIRGEIRKWKGKIAAKPIEVESKKEDVIQNALGQIVDPKPIEETPASKSHRLRLAWLDKVAPTSGSATATKIVLPSEQRNSIQNQCPCPPSP